MPESAVRPSASILAAAVVFLLTSSVILFFSLWYLKSVYDHAGSMNQVLLYAQAPTVAIFDFMMLLQIALGLLGIVISIGLLRLQERARIAAIFLSVAFILGLFFALFLFLEAGDANGGASIIAAYGILIYGGCLVVLLPLCIWWLVLLTREKVRSQFR